MKSLLILLFASLCITCAGQDISKGLDSMRKELAKNMASYDSAKKISESLMVFNNKRFDSVEMVRNNQNLDALVQTMHERDQKQRWAMWMRLIFGVLLLGVGIFGIFRKRKKKDIQ